MFKKLILLIGITPGNTCGSFLKEIGSQPAAMTGLYFAALKNSGIRPYSL
jgi:hypothetical protein